MEILFLCHRLPFPPDKGDKIRSHAILNHLAARHKVHLACFIDDPDDDAHIDEVRRLAGGECLFVTANFIKQTPSLLLAGLLNKPLTIALRGSAAMRHWVKSISHRRKISSAVVFSSAMVPFILDQDKSLARRSIFDMVDIDSDKWDQYSLETGPLKAWIYKREARHLFQLERRAARDFAFTTLVSEFEAETFASLAPETKNRLHVLENGVDLQFFSHGQFSSPFNAHEIPVVMTGRMDYRPNADAAEWFVRKVLPLVQKQLPRVRFYAIGSHPSKRALSLSSPHVTVTGRVPDVRPYIQHAAVVVAPLRLARGVQNKVLEAMAMGRPVVATWEASRAIRAKAGEDLWVANGAEAFAEATISTIVSKESDAIARSGRRYVERFHDWRSNLSVLDQLIESAAGSGTHTFSHRPLAAEPSRRPRPATYRATTSDWRQR